MTPLSEFRHHAITTDLQKASLYSLSTGECLLSFGAEICRKDPDDAGVRLIKGPYKYRLEHYALLCDKLLHACLDNLHLVRGAEICEVLRLESFFRGGLYLGADANGAYIAELWPFPGAAKPLLIRAASVHGTYLGPVSPKEWGKDGHEYKWGQVTVVTGRPPVNKKPTDE